MQDTSLNEPYDLLGVIISSSRGANPIICIVFESSEERKFCFGSPIVQLQYNAETLDK